MSRRRLRPGLRKVHGRPTAAEVVRDARERGMQSHVVRVVSSKAEFLDAVGDALAFPGWTGRNWDALADAVSDLSWLPSEPLVLVWSAPEQLRAADPEAYDMAVEILAEVAKSSADSERPLTVLLLEG